MKNDQLRSLKDHLGITDHPQDQSRTLTPPVQEDVPVSVTRRGRTRAPEIVDITPEFGRFLSYIMKSPQTLMQFHNSALAVKKLRDRGIANKSISKMTGVSEPRLTAFYKAAAHWGLSTLRFAVEHEGKITPADLFACTEAQWLETPRSKRGKKGLRSVRTELNFIIANGRRSDFLKSVHSGLSVKRSRAVLHESQKLAASNRILRSKLQETQSGELEERLQRLLLENRELKLEQVSGGRVAAPKNSPTPDEERLLREVSSFLGVRVELSRGMTVAHTGDLSGDVLAQLHAALFELKVRSR